ncbi:hypothetical protein CCUS01_02971 [Colletotrichum cuscutae]|uniref:Uncharacterized protein n=1 Tax=Colletotrichum cuscutae TaxID=1209917 RepID=A0AAI9YAW4_9PEZI|nr:hypothetical protein CCUS01_02971 [Colletotrichum cuscutae]
MKHHKRKCRHNDILLVGFAELAPNHPSSNTSFLLKCGRSPVYQLRIGEAPPQLPRRGYTFMRYVSYAYERREPTTKQKSLFWLRPTTEGLCVLSEDKGSR